MTEPSNQHSPEYLTVECRGCGRTVGAMVDSQTPIIRCAECGATTRHSRGTSDDSSWLFVDRERPDVHTFPDYRPGDDDE